ncbi:MAG TPA: galactokinase [bacterium]|nr:galactokinase [bacterium]
MLIETQHIVPWLKKHSERMISLYGDATEGQWTRYEDLLRCFQKFFDQPAAALFSTPGRSEIGGNHTDHNQGRVLSAAVHLDSIGLAAPSREKRVILYSKGYDPFRVDLNDLSPRSGEEGTTRALIRGIVARLQELGYSIGGLDACISSNVMVGSGLSSSASIEVLIADFFNVVYNQGKLPPELLARIGQYAENQYFGKPCGLMDQLTCAVGGIVTIDFKNQEQPSVDRLSFRFRDFGYQMLVVNTGCGHEDLTDDYAAVPEEMRRAARALGGHVLRDIDEELFFKALPALRKEAGDRAVLRAMHFFRENERVARQADALRQGDFPAFLERVRWSGDSSFRWLQNVINQRNPMNQGVALGLALTEKFFEEAGEGACRVHGGGFAGTIQAFMPTKTVSAYVDRIEKVFGRGSVIRLNIRPFGAWHLEREEAS